MAGRKKQANDQDTNQEQEDRKEQAERKQLLDYEFYQIAKRHGQSPRKVYAILNYLDPESPTAGNWHQSYNSAVGREVTKLAAFQARHTKRTDYMIRDIIEVTNTGKLPRLHALRGIIEGTYVKRTTTKDKHGKTLTVVESTPTAADIRGAIDVLNKMDGTYVREEAKKTVYTEELRRLARESRPDGVDG